MGEISFIENSDHYRFVVEQGILAARNSLWIATANIKDLRVKWSGSKTISIIETLNHLAGNGTEIRLLHAGKPSRAFIDEFLSSDNGFSMISCQRVHFKTVIRDGLWAYSGSANLTGAGIGMKSEGKRNFETGFITTSHTIIDRLQSLFNLVWEGEYCNDCHYSKNCIRRS